MKRISQVERVDRKNKSTEFYWKPPNVHALFLIFLFIYFSESKLCVLRPYSIQSICEL